MKEEEMTIKEINKNNKEKEKGKWKNKDKEEIRAEKHTFRRKSE